MRNFLFCFWFSSYFYMLRGKRSHSCICVFCRGVDLPVVCVLLPADQSVDPHSELQRGPWGRSTRHHRLLILLHRHLGELCLAFFFQFQSSSTTFSASKLLLWAGSQCDDISPNKQPDYLCTLVKVNRFLDMLFLDFFFKKYTSCVVYMCVAWPLWQTFHHDKSFLSCGFCINQQTTHHITPYWTLSSWHTNPISTGNNNVSLCQPTHHKGCSQCPASTYIQHLYKRK